MRAPFFRAALFTALLPSVLAKDPSSGSSSNAPAKTPAASQRSAKEEKSPDAKDKQARGPTIDGEHFTVRQIIDRQQGGMPVCIFIAPEKWRDQSQVVWNYANNSSPVKVGAAVENPANEEACYVYPAAEFFCLRPDGGYYRPGQNFGGLTYTYQPLAPAPALLGFVQQIRGSMPKFQVVGMKDLPDLPSALNLPASPNQRGVGLKVKYELKDKPIEEEFYGVFYSIQIPYDGPQGRTWQINWGLNALHSFRAADGTLDKRKEVFAAIARSFRPNPTWRERLTAVNSYLAEQFNRQLQAGYDQIAAAGALSRQISANNDAMIAAIDQRMAASRAASHPSSKAGTGRSANDKFDDYIRGVETVDDPYYGTSQHSYNNQYHWTDGYGNYRHSNEGTYNPNQHENGDWQLMTPTR